MAKTAKQHLQTDKQAKIVVLEKAFAGAQAGQKMYVATPQIVDSYIKQIPPGQSQTVEQMRRNLASQAGCDVTCPMSTAIFVRISAQAAIDELNEGANSKMITPFWRIITSQDKVAKKLTIDANWIDLQRAGEQI